MILLRLLRWGETRHQVSNLNLAVLAVITFVLSVVGTSVLTQASETTQPLAAEQPAHQPAFGQTGVGRSGICAEIRSRPTDPPMTRNCARIRLYRANVDLDYPPGGARSADLLVENGVIRAGKRAHFLVLGINERPSFGKCASGRAGLVYWVSFAELPGHTLCIRSDEGRIGLIQAETVNPTGTEVVARLTVWDQT